MTLLQASAAYVTLKRAWGAVFAAEARILRSFGGTVGDVPVAAITPAQCQAFCRGVGPPTRFWARKHETLRGFFRYLVGRGQLARSPLPEPGPRIPASFQPYIYSREELQRLLAAAATPVSPRALVQPATLRPLLLLLYGAGLRAGEALRLRGHDVDLRERVLVIWDTKFFKSRLVPLGTSLAAALAHSATERGPRPGADGDRLPFFATRSGEAIRLGRLEAAFRRVREQAGVRRPSGARWQPRLHDLRATFAVHRLTAWYREGADVQARLPLLATVPRARQRGGHASLLASHPGPAGRGFAALPALRFAGGGGRRCMTPTPWAPTCAASCWNTSPPTAT